MVQVETTAEGREGYGFEASGNPEKGRLRGGEALPRLPNVRAAILNYASKFKVKLTPTDIGRLSEFSLQEWLAPPPNEDSARDLFSAYLWHVGRRKEAERIQRTPSTRGRMLKRLLRYLGGESKRKPKTADKVTEPPYEELKCPICGAIMLGDLPVIDHYLEHRRKFRVGGVEIRELKDYRQLDPQLKLKAYKKAKRFFVKGGGRRRR